MRAVISSHVILPRNCGSDIIAWIFPVSRRSVLCASLPTSPNCVSASSTKISTFTSAISNRRSRSKMTSVCPNHILRMFFNTRTGISNSPASPSKINVFPLPMGPQTLNPEIASAPVEVIRGIRRVLRNSTNFRLPTMSFSVCAGFLNSTTSSPNCAWINSETFSMTASGRSFPPA